MCFLVGGCSEGLPASQVVSSSVPCADGLDVCVVCGVASPDLFSEWVSNSRVRWIGIDQAHHADIPLNIAHDRVRCSSFVSPHLLLQRIGLKRLNEGEDLGHDGESEVVICESCAILLMPKRHRRNKVCVEKNASGIQNKGGKQTSLLW